MKEENSCSLSSTFSLKPAAKLDRGRWKAEEHELFLKGVKMYGRDWKKIERLVGTRTGPQIRSHAQKYFNKVNKEKQQHEGTSSPSSSNKGSATSLFSLTELKRSTKKEHDKTRRLKNRSIPKMEDSIFKSKVGTAENSLNPDEMKYLDNTVRESGINTSLEQSSGKRFYSEDEVLLLIKNLVKEFGNIVDKISNNRPSFSPGNGGLGNLNSILILSLMMGEQSKAPMPQNLFNSPMDGLNTNLLTSLSDISKIASLPSMVNLPGLPKPNDLSALLNSQVQKKGEEKISSENLLKIPKIKSCPKVNNPSLDVFLEGECISQSDNSINLPGHPKPAVPTFSSGGTGFKRYDNLQVEGKEELFSIPTLESKQDAN
ncbi:unnamed protein product [Moneuplotes crassus]|uniref:Uncharacterized protein n=1 Tax=Euplotes crassus TaxID=5936 RepID=A0AAD1UBK0_EUPCR|nr:unnamed protein product [Moneuplotes crassus]